jgi:predicted dienelactone hydrolase
MFVFILLAAAAARAADYDPDAKKMEITSMQAVWHDAARDRDVPVKIYYPKSGDAKGGDGKFPIIIFSHGLGGSRAGYGYLGEYWASHGYVAVHLTHIGSDTEAIMANGLDNLKQTGQAIATDPMNAVNRIKDVSFAIDQITTANSDEKFPLYHKLDLDHIGMAGHSFGAGTTTLIAGELSHSGKSYVDNRVKCAIAMCPPITIPKAAYDKSYAGIKIPLFVMTGTKDDSPIGETKAADRRVPFDHVKDIPAYLITFDGGDHMLFSGNKQRAKQPTDDRYHLLIQQGSVAFWDAYLKEDGAAKNYLAGGGYEKAVGDGGKFEERNVQ